MGARSIQVKRVRKVRELMMNNDVVFAPSPKTAIRSLLRSEVPMVLQRTIAAGMEMMETTMMNSTPV
jgi:ABC-type polar amino acid transport system ATPase subunit